MPVVNQSLDLDRVEDLLLIRKRPDLQSGDGDRDPIAVRRRRGDQRVVQAVPVVSGS